MMRHSANKTPPPALGVFSPLRYAVFRRIWTASLLSNLGLLVLGVGAAWTMTKISSSTGMVALVQTSLMLPVALVSTPAGRSPTCLIGGSSGSLLYRSRWPAQFRSQLWHGLAS